MRRFKPGETIELREVWRGKIWEIRTAIVVEDSDEMIALYTPAGSPAQVAIDDDGNYIRVPLRDWTLAPTPRPAMEILGVHVPGTQHSLLAIFDPPKGYGPWYINLESDLQRIDAGFECEEHLLDVIIERDLSSWRWKDEDELEEAVAHGMFTLEQAAEFRAEGERALEWLMQRRPPYDRDWLSWRPPAEWRAG